MDIEGLLKSLNARDVEYVIIGASAFPVHGYARATLDVDLFIRPTRANAERAWKALKESGYDVADITLEDLLAKKLLIRQHVLETDIHPFVEGVTFEEVWRNKVTSAIGETPASFASLDDLIAMKKAAGRDRDRKISRCCSRSRKSPYAAGREPAVPPPLVKSPPAVPSPPSPCPHGAGWAERNSLARAASGHDG